MTVPLIREPTPAGVSGPDGTVRERLTIGVVPTPSKEDAVQHNEIVVGYDASASSRTALRYAVAQAKRLDASLRLLAAFDHNWHGRAGDADTFEHIVRERLQALVDQAADEVVAADPDLDVSGAAVLGFAGGVLADASRTATMVTVGNRGHGGFGGLTLGSVSQYVALHAHCPVIVVRGTVDAVSGPVAVGVDGSVWAEHTLRVAFEEAARRGAEVIAVRAYQQPVPYGIMAVGALPYHSEELRHVATDALVNIVRPWQEKFPDVKVGTHVAEGSPGRVLVEVSSGATLVVIGSHGNGSFAGTLLGSAVLQVLQHADCPVLVVRHDRRAS